MIRDPARLAEREFDVLVVGGGIYGLTIAYDAAQRGLSVALIDRGDFGSATSFNHLKTIHGGLRYLQSGDVRRMRESIRERRTFARIAPRWVAPLAFAMPTGSSWMRTPIVMRTALEIDALIGRDRNDGVDSTRHLPAGRVVAGAECRELFEGAIRTVASAAVWHDYQTINGDRLTLSFAKAADAHGAVLVNYAEAVGPLTAPRSTGVRARDNLTRQSFDIRARSVVNAAGPWTAMLLDRSGLRMRWPLLKAMNIVTSRPARRVALVGATRSGRALVLLPWNGRTLIGTSESPAERDPDDQDANREEIDAFLAEIRGAFPDLDLTFDEITLVHRGIVPAAPAEGRTSLLGRSRIIDHAGQNGIPELISIVGVKYTTARAVAQKTVDLILRKLQRRAERCRTAGAVLPDAAMADREPSDPIRHAIDEEMAHTLIDVVVRRTGLGGLGYPGDAAAGAAAGRMQQLLGWSDERVQSEVTALRNFYRIT